MSSVILSQFFASKEPEPIDTVIDRDVHNGLTEFQTVFDGFDAIVNPYGIAAGTE
jgi:hypothetical protein